MSNVKVIIGANYGDEGKGLMTDYFAAEAKRKEEFCLVVMSNGGAQRGHTVSTPEGIRHVFHHFGSGTFSGVRTYFPEYFIVNPMVFKKEFTELKNTIGDVNKPIVNRNCMVTTPFDMIANQIFEDTRGENKHGSCGMGIWETVRRYKRGSLPYGFYEEQIRFNQGKEIRRKLEGIKLYYEKLFADKNMIMSDEWKEIWNNPELINHYIEDVYFFSHNTASKGSSSFIKYYDTVIFENAQGLCLDQNFGYDERYTTPSNTGLTNPGMEIKTYLPNADVEVCYITRTYLTRHGNGPLPGECSKSEINQNMIDETNIPNQFQGSLRYAKLDYDAISTRINDDFSIAPKHWKKSIAITHLNEYPWKDDDILSGFDNIYESDGTTRKSVEERRL